MEVKLSHLEFLVSAGAAMAPHAHGSLLAHLRGTHRMLTAWRSEEHVCLAGLFHSIYGTSIYAAGCVGLDRRADVALVIGERAERLAFLFGVAHRPQALLDAITGAPLVNRVDERPLQVSDHEVSALLEIECANLLEQGLGRAFLSRLMQQVRDGHRVLRGPVVRAVELALQPAVQPGS